MYILPSSLLREMIISTQAVGDVDDIIKMPAPVCSSLPARAQDLADQLCASRRGLRAGPAASAGAQNRPAPPRPVLMFPSWPRPRPRGARPRPHVGGLSGHRPPPPRGSQWRVSSAPPPAKMAGAVSVRAGWGSEPSPQRTTETEGAARAMEGVGGGDGGARQRELERMAEVLVTGEQLR